MFSVRTQELIVNRLAEIKQAGTWKEERQIASPQGVEIVVAGRRVLNFCANNYLGLSNHPQLVAAAKAAIEERGYGLSSVRFICGTQDQHRALERRLAEFFIFDDALLFSSCYDANGGIFEALLEERDAVISDALNHASIIDGIRLCKAKRFRYANRDMADLEKQLRDAADARFRLVVTDGVFSMDGFMAPLPEICDLADRHDAIVMVDDSHAVGFVGEGGRGTHELHGVMGRVDIITGTLGKAMGGASGGYVAARSEVVDLLRQRARPYLFSNSLAPPITAASLRALDLIEGSSELRGRLAQNTEHFRARMGELGFEILPGSHPIVPVMVGDAVKAARLAEGLISRGVYAVSFSFPVVPRDTARIRTQMSAAHSIEDLDFAIEQF